jgi:hypothetical protein
MIRPVVTLLRILNISHGAPTERDGEDVCDLGFIQRRVSRAESCLLVRIALPNFARSRDEEYSPLVLEEGMVLAFEGYCTLGDMNSTYGASSPTGWKKEPPPGGIAPTPLRDGLVTLVCINPKVLNTVSDMTEA